MITLATSDEQSEQYTLIQAGRKAKSQAPDPTQHDEETLVDTTAALTLVSRKTKRLEKQHQRKKSIKRKTYLLDLPAEILLEILSWLPPSGIICLLVLNNSVQSLILSNQSYITKTVIQRRYSILAQCFPLPVLATQVDEATQAILLGSRRQQTLRIQKIPYQHIAPVDISKICTCSWCIFCWYNLNLVPDLNHFQRNLDERIPIPIIPRGTNPMWNLDLLAKNSLLVTKATTNPLLYALILEKHLETIVRTITRKHKLQTQIKSGSGKWIPSNRTVSVSLYSDRPYNLTDKEARLGTDDFLERYGRPSYEFPYQRDNYYSLEVYLPNRKWSQQEEKWVYYDNQHDKDVALALRWFGPAQVR